MGRACKPDRSRHPTGQRQGVAPQPRRRERMSSDCVGERTNFLIHSDTEVHRVVSRQARSASSNSGLRSIAYTKPIVMMRLYSPISILWNRASFAHHRVPSIGEHTGSRQLDHTPAGVPGPPQGRPGCRHRDRIPTRGDRDTSEAVGWLAVGVGAISPRITPAEMPHPWIFTRRAACSCPRRRVTLLA